MLMLFLELLKDLIKMFKYRKNMFKYQWCTFKPATTAKMKIPFAITMKTIRVMNQFSKKFALSIYMYVNRL